MARSDMLKLSVMLALFLATAFVSVATVAADDWYGQNRSPANSSGAVVAPDWSERLAPLDWYFAHDHAVLDGDNNVVPSVKNLMDNRLAPLDWYFAHDHAVLDGDNNVVSNGK